MIISYNWLCEYLPPISKGLPESLDPEKIANILTAVGLEVESLEKYEAIKGGLKGLIVGEILTCKNHPKADKLKVTTVSLGDENELQIVCGATNVSAGQKVIIAPVNSEIYPTAGGKISIINVKIRGIESQGMICSEDEIGLGHNHEGILVLPPDTVAGTPVADVIVAYEDYIFEIGLTPNRIDAMSHVGVARDVCAYLSHHYKKDYKVVFPFKSTLKAHTGPGMIKVKIENQESCKRYSGISIKDITVTDSPVWLKHRLKSIGVKSINNIVDITNFILHETGQPLHAFDADQITGNKIIVKNLPEGSPFVTLDEKEKKISASDLMICNESAPMCIAGVYGGLNSGVTTSTRNIFLESAWFSPSTIRIFFLLHGLRTDAAARYEKGIDISNTAIVLERAAMLITETAGGNIDGDIIDLYPVPLPRTMVDLKYNYLKKLSGKNFPVDIIKNILKSLDFEIVKDGTDEIWVNVPFSKPDITLPADIVEEIMRIDGLDNIEIPQTISISPAIEKDAEKFELSEKIAAYLTSSGFYEIFTNSISNSRLYDEQTLSTAIKMINSLSSELDIMRPSLLQSGLQAIAYNMNRKNNDLCFYEFGKTYEKTEDGYKEPQHLCLYVTGRKNLSDWKNKESHTDIYHLKGMIERIFIITGVKNVYFTIAANNQFKNYLEILVNNKYIGFFGEVDEAVLKKHDIKQPVFYADIFWNDLITLRDRDEVYREISKFPAAQRDLSLILNKNTPFAAIKKITENAHIDALASVELFDVFESDKLGAGKKSLSINYIFSDDTRTLTDKDIDAFMDKLMLSYQKELDATIRK